MYTNKFPLRRILVIIGTGFAAGTAIFCAWTFGPGRSSANAQQSAATDVHIPVGASNSASAFTQASQLAGFDVHAPTFLPPGDSISEIFFPSNVTTRAFRAVQIGVRGGNGGFLVSETNNSFRPPEEATALPSTLQGVTMSMLRGADGVTYFALSQSGRGYAMTLRTSSTISGAEAVKILEGIAVP